MSKCFSRDRKSHLKVETDLAPWRKSYFNKKIWCLNCLQVTDPGSLENEYCLYLSSFNRLLPQDEISQEEEHLAPANKTNPQLYTNDGHGCSVIFGSGHGIRNTFTLDPKMFLLLGLVWRRRWLTNQTEVNSQDKVSWANRRAICSRWMAALQQSPLLRTPVTMSTRQSQRKAANATTVSLWPAALASPAHSTTHK